MAQLGAQAAFLAAGGYHHHLGANTWESGGAPPPPPGTAALRHATIVLPDESERGRVLERIEQAGLAPSESDGSPLVRIRRRTRSGWSSPDRPPRTTEGCARTGGAHRS